MSRVAYSSVLPIGARHITNDWQLDLESLWNRRKKLNCFYQAILKKQSGFPEEQEEEKLEKSSDEVDLSPLGLSEELKKVSKKL